MTNQISTCNLPRWRFPDGYFVPHPETTQSIVSRRWEVYGDGEIETLPIEKTGQAEAYGVAAE